jgi:hypothetical protein
MRFFILLAALLLAGCMSAEERIAADNDQCAAYGFTAGTDAFAQCRQQLQAQRNAILMQGITTPQMMGPRNCTSYGMSTTCF